MNLSAPPDDALHGRSQSEKNDRVVFNELNTKDGAPRDGLNLNGLPVSKRQGTDPACGENILSNALKFTKPGVQPRNYRRLRRDDKAYVFYYKTTACFNHS